MYKGGENLHGIIYKELSYKVVGILFGVFNGLGYGYQEKCYQKATEVAFRKTSTKHRSQCPYKIRYKGEVI